MWFFYFKCWWKPSFFVQCHIWFINTVYYVVNKNISLTYAFAIFWSGSIFLTSEKIEAVVQRCSVKKLFLKISQNSQENTCARVFFSKVVGLRPAILLKMRLWNRCLPVNFAKFLRTPIFIEHLRWLLLKKIIHGYQNRR